MLPGQAQQVAPVALEHPRPSLTVQLSPLEGVVVVARALVVLALVALVVVALGE